MVHGGGAKQVGLPTPYDLPGESCGTGARPTSDGTSRQIQNPTVLAPMVLIRDSSGHSGSGPGWQEVLLFIYIGNKIVHRILVHLRVAYLIQFYTNDIALNFIVLNNVMVGQNR